MDSAAPDRLCRSYLVVVPDAYERQKAIEAIAFHLPCKPSFFSGGESSFETIVAPFSSLSLFEEEVAVCVEDVDKLPAGEVARLKEWMKSALQSGFFLCSAGAKTSLAPTFEKNGVILDLSEEKPWEKEKRLTEELIKKAQSEKKRIAPDALSLLFERVGKEPSFLDSELEKLIVYVGEKEWIEEKDVRLITKETVTRTLWFFAEEIVWEKRVPLDVPFPFSALIAPLRNQLHMGRMILSLLSSSVPPEEWSTYLPKMWPKLLEKRTFQAQSLGVNYFEKGLRLLFDLELLARSGQGHEEALLFLFGSSLGR
ncbi:MAG TPA: hypothetical protein VJK48_04785 [Chlamydiales bacterium]|nr:hypothetical protein [Chlamydiales bacterium]